MKFEVFVRSVFKQAFVVLVMPWLFLLVKSLEILEPRFKVRIGQIHAERIGSFVQEVNWYLKHLAIHGGKQGFHLLFTDKSSNRQLMTMIKRRLYVIENVFLMKICEFIYLHLKSSPIMIKFPSRLNEYYQDVNGAVAQLAFTREEIAKGRQELLRMNIPPPATFICFQSRDSAYLNAVNPGSDGQKWAYHSYRDSKISNYLPAAEYFAAIGIFALRVGYMVEDPLAASNPKIIDYAADYRSDFMDIYLLGNCKFFLGNNSGLLCVAQAFDVPVAAANWIPLKVTLMCKRDIFIPKKLWNIREKRFLTFREIIQSRILDFSRTEEYDQAGIEAVENTGEEILALAKEMNARMDNLWVTTPEDEELQQRYRGFFGQEQASYGFPSRIGAEFLRQNKELLN